MILTLEEFKSYVQTNETDVVLTAYLEALEQMIHRYTNNDFKRILEANKGEYPMDVKMGVVNLMKWELGSREKIGVASESISRHSVTYFDMSGDNSIMGYPKALMGFLRPYMRARFGKGLGV